jgi:glycosyltransferase involved in cell wall biosynthesis
VHLRTLRVGIDGRAWTSQAAGIRRYVSGLVPALLELGQALEIVALGGSEKAIPRGIARIDEPPHPPTNLGWTAVGLPWAASRAGVDLIHAPAYTAPLASRVPTVLTIHDVSYERHPEWYPYRRDSIRRAFYRRSARSAAQIVTDSEFSAGEITAAYGIPRARITVAPLGVSHVFVPQAPGSTRELPAGVPPAFLLHVGDLHERRNVGVVVQALIDATKEGTLNGRISLVLAGVDRGTGDAVRDLAAAASMPDLVICLGAVPEDCLIALYRQAAALVYPSRYEGFGLPVLEAMACGTPVIASRAASMPEVIGEAGILLDPDDVRAWSNAIVNVLTDEVLRGRMRANGLARATEFTWARTARLTYDAYCRVVSSPRTTESQRHGDPLA